MKELLDNYFAVHRRELVESISELVEIPSVKGEAENGKPYGEMPFAALTKALEIADSFGFKTKNYDGYVGAVDFNENETNLNIFAHLDVVAAGDGWHTQPYKMTEKDGVLYGRGVSDDKGPAMAALYAMKAVRDSGIKLSKNVRLVLGTDEECGSSDLAYYFSKEKAAPWSFTPDANFPVTNGEKGRFSKNFCGEYSDNSPARYVEKIYGGEVGNAVPSACEAVVRGLSDDEIKRCADEISRTTKTDFEVDGGKIICRGTSAHASLPFMGNNPITAMLALLCALPLEECESTEKIHSLGRFFPHGDWLGKAFGIEMRDKLGELTLTLDIIRLENGRISGFFDARTPMTADKENCADKVESALSNSGFTLENNDIIPAHYVDESSDFIQILLENYEIFTGEKGGCISMGGGTYVHNVEGGVAFGAIKKGVNTNMHGADEFMPVDDLITAAKIYAGVIYDLCR